MPMFFVGFDTDGRHPHPGAHGLAPFLHQTAALFHEEQLLGALAMPVGASARLESTR